MPFLFGKDSRWLVEPHKDGWGVKPEIKPEGVKRTPVTLFETREEAIACAAGKACEKEETVSDTPNHAQSIDDVMGEFQAGITALGRRAAEIKAGTQRAFGKVELVFDHAEHVNTYIEGKADSLSRFLGPPPNEINMPKIERAKAEDAKIVE